MLQEKQGEMMDICIYVCINIYIYILCIVHIYVYISYICDKNENSGISLRIAMMM